MPIGLVSDADFLLEIARSVPGGHIKPVNPPTPRAIEPEVVEPIAHPVVAEILPLEKAGRKSGDTNVPESLRKVIGEEAVINGRASALSLAKDFGVSPSSVSAYTKGATSTASINSPVKDLIGHINKSRQRAITRAQNTLNGALGAITQEKLDFTDAKDLSSIAKDMSVVIKNLEPPQLPQVDPSTISTPQFTIYAPHFRDERTFETIVVKE
jgi:predicted transcriptional regulator